MRSNWLSQELEYMGGLEGRERKQREEGKRAGLRGSLEARSERDKDKSGIYPHVNENYSSKHGISQFTIEQASCTIVLKFRLDIS